MSAQKSNKKKTSELVQTSEVPVVLKRDCWKKDMLICESQDQEINFVGDSGAVGRMTIENKNLLLDLKGRQYIGDIVSGPTIMILNLTAPVAPKKKKEKEEKVEDDDEDAGEDGDKSASKTKSKVTTSSSSSSSSSANAAAAAAVPKQIARCEVITNEFCRLEFQQDTLSSLKGEITGGYTEGGDEMGDVQATKRNPKISTVTTKRRVAKASKKKTAKAKSK